MLNGSTGFEEAHTCADGIFIGGPRDGSHIVSVSTKSCKSMWNRAEGLGQQETLLLMWDKCQPGLEFSPKCDSMAPQENPASTLEKKVIEKWTKWIQVNPNCCNQRIAENVRETMTDCESMIIDLAATPRRPTRPAPSSPPARAVGLQPLKQNPTNEFDAAYHHMAILAIICWHEFRASNKFAPSNMNVLQSGIASGQLRCY